jgi:hypothetical protein
MTDAYNFSRLRNTITAARDSVQPASSWHRRKRWISSPRSTVAAPRATRGQYHSDVDRRTRHRTLSRLPRDGHQFVLEQGDVLYNPPRHHVESDRHHRRYRFTHAGSSLRASDSVERGCAAWTRPLATGRVRQRGRGAIRTSSSGGPRRGTRARAGIVVHEGPRASRLCGVVRAGAYDAALSSRDGRTPTAPTNARIAFASLAFALIGLEAVLRTRSQEPRRPPRAELAGVELHYATPTNSMGYREGGARPSCRGDGGGRRGDSNTFGAASTMSTPLHQPADQRPGRARVHNLGVNGASTRHEIDRRCASRAGRTSSLQYHINDLDAPGFEVARRTREIDIRDPIAHADVPAHRPWCGTPSAQLRLLAQPPTTLTPYITSPRPLEDEDVGRHRGSAKLSKIQQQTDPVIAPAGRRWTKRASNTGAALPARGPFGGTREVVVEVRDEAELPLSQRIVNANDPHPSRAVHAMMASAPRRDRGRGLFGPVATPAGTARPLAAGAVTGLSSP